MSAINCLKTPPQSAVANYTIISVDIGKNGGITSVNIEESVIKD